MKKLSFILCMAVAIFFGSCNREQQVIQPHSDSNKKNPAAARLAVYPLDWENIDRMPTPPGMVSVLAPWASGASRQFSREMVDDYRRADGWELLYNTFNTSILEASWYFILYNKYRGVVRLYYYIPPNANFIASANIIHKLATEGSYAASSPVMNFSGQDIIDVNRNVTFASTLEKFQVAPNTWYAFQYELAYDRNVENQSFANFNFLWPVTSTQIQEAKFNGTADGSLKGSIKLPGNDFAANPVLNIVQGSGQINITGSSEADNLLKTLGKAAVDGAKKAITKGVAGIVEGVLGGIFSNKSDKENVNLTLNARIDLNGTLTQNFLIQSKALAVSGYDQTTTVGFVPAYNQPLGVFYLSQNPVINVEMVREFLDPRDRSTLQVTRTYTLAPIQYIFNPAVINIANIVVRKQEIIMSRGAIGGSGEIINGTTYTVGNNLRTVNNAPPILGVRVTLDVIPKDGSPKVTLAKTFATRRF